MLTICRINTMSSYYISRDGGQAVPYEETDIRHRLQEGILTLNDLCWQEGMADWRPIGEVPALASGMTGSPSTVQPHDLAQPTPLFLYVPVARLIWLSILSMGIYEAYWMYRNWRYVKERDQLRIRPFWRGLFSVFFCHSLFRRIYEDTEARAVYMPVFSPSTLATNWIILILLGNALSRVPVAGVVILAAFVPSFLCLLPVQKST